MTYQETYQCYDGLPLPSFIKPALFTSGFLELTLIRFVKVYAAEKSEIPGPCRLSTFHLLP